MKIYQEAKINPLAGCLPLLIQMPILIGLFNVLKDPVSHGVFPNADVAAQAAQATQKPAGGYHSAASAVERQFLAYQP